MLHAVVLFCAALAWPDPTAADPTANAHVYTVQKKVYRLETDFEMVGERPEGVAIRRHYRPRNTYAFYNSREELLTYGVERLVSVGSIVAKWGATLDVYDAQDAYIGNIKGDLLSGGKATFAFSDEVGERYAVAHLDRTGAGFTIRDVLARSPEPEVASMSRDNIGGVSDVWHVSVWQPGLIDERLLRVFGAFVVDNQEALAGIAR